MTDWSKVMEVFVSGIVGVYVIMFLLMIMTKIGIKVVDVIENWGKKPAAGTAAAEVLVKEKEGQHA